MAPGDVAYPPNIHTVSKQVSVGMIQCDISAPVFLQNYPLYIRSAPTQSELKFHYTVHTSLDVVEEKISAVGKAMADQRELYLGLLYPTEDYKVYPSFHVLQHTTDTNNISLR